MCSNDTTEQNNEKGGKERTRGGEEDMVEKFCTGIEANSNSY